MKVQNPYSIMPLPTFFRRSGRAYSGAWSGSVVNVLAVANIFIATPYIPSKVEKPDQIQMYVAIGDAGFVRIGIYADDGTVWPGAKMFGSAALVTDAPALLTEALVGITLIPGNLYWLASLFNAAPTLTGMRNEDILQCLGYDNASGPIGYGIYEPLVYAALPAIAPKTPALAAIAAPGITLRIP
jgi:hypothetical protein